MRIEILAIKSVVCGLIFTCRDGTKLAAGMKMRQKNMAGHILYSGVPQLWPLVGQQAGANKYCGLNAPEGPQNAAMPFHAKIGQITGQKRQCPRAAFKLQYVPALQGAELA